MTPTPEQLESIARAYFDGPHDVREAIGCAIDVWESIRPKEDQSQLQRTNHALAAEMADVKTELNARLHERTQAFLAKERGLIRQRDALNEQLLDAQYKVSMHEAHSKDWEPLVSYMQNGGSPRYGVIGECCFAVALRQLKKFEAEQSGIKADCRLMVQGELERAEFMAAMLAKYPEFDGATDFAEGALAGWKARAAKGGSEA